LVNRPSWEQRINAMLARAGVQLARHRPPERRLARFLRENDIGLVIDVGASCGQFGSMLRRAGYMGRIISFEPVSAAYQVLEKMASNDAGWESHRVALADRDGVGRMHVSKNLASSSFLDINHPLDAYPEAAYVGTEEVRTARLDSIAAGFGIGDRPTMLKIDVQGFTLEVLAGSAQNLGRVSCLQVEMSLVSLYASEPTMLTLLRYLDERGFALTEIEPGFYERDTGRLLQVDGRFIRAGR
jgi:FkbM family methyltransferase